MATKTTLGLTGTPSKSYTITPKGEEPTPPAGGDGKNMTLLGVG